MQAQGAGASSATSTSSNSDPPSSSTTGEPERASTARWADRATLARIHSHKVQAVAQAKRVAGDNAPAWGPLRHRTVSGDRPELDEPLPHPRGKTLSRRRPWP